MIKLADYLQNPQINLVAASTDFANLMKSFGPQILRVQPRAKPVLDQMMGHAVNCQTEADNVMDTVAQLMAQPTPQLFQAAQRTVAIFAGEVMKASVNLTQLETLAPGSSLADLREVLTDLTQAYKYLEQEIKNFAGAGHARKRGKAQILGKVAKILDAEGLFSLAMEADALLDKIAKTNPKAKVRNRGTVIFPANSRKVKDKKDHFPINSESQARNALARANAFKKVPPWFKGSLEDLVSAVVSAVKRKYKKIDISEKSEKPGKG